MMYINTLMESMLVALSDLSKNEILVVALNELIFPRDPRCGIKWFGFIVRTHFVALSLDILRDPSKHEIQH